MSKINFNGHIYEVDCFYAGISVYVVYEDGNQVYYGYSVDEIIERFGFNLNNM